jgi:hypothetical protein
MLLAIDGAAIKSPESVPQPWLRFQELILMLFEACRTDD